MTILRVTVILAAAAVLALGPRLANAAPSRATAALAGPGALLDDFNRPNEDPLFGGGTWEGPMVRFGTELRLVSNRVAGTAVTTSRSYWLAGFAADQEVSVTVADLANDVDDSVNVFCRLTDPSPTTTRRTGSRRCS